MIIQTQLSGNTAVATVKVKEANLTVSDQFKQEMTALIDSGSKFIVVNFEEVQYVDSSFLGALVASLKYALPKQAEIVVAGMNKDIDGLFHLIRLNKAFRTYSSAEEALNNRTA